MVAVGAGMDNDGGVSSLVNAIKDISVTEKDKCDEAEVDDKLLEINYACANRGEHIQFWWEIKPQDAIVDKYGVPIMTTGRTKKAPIRIMIVLDISHSMSEPFGEVEGTISKLERVKIFATMLVKQLKEEDTLGIVTFGTTAKLVSPLRKMTDENKKDTLASIHQIEIGGVTNLSAGLLLAQEQFIHIQIGIRKKAPAFDDNIIVFTDGMANEGVTDTEELINAIRRRTHELKEENRYPDGYSIRISTLGTGGFMPSMLYEIGQAFSSDALYILDDSSNLELNIFKPLLLRFATFAHRIKGKILALNGAKFYTDLTVCDFQHAIHEQAFADCDTELQFYMHDICEDSARHLSTSIMLPKKHKTLLKGMDVIHIQIDFEDRSFSPRMVQQTIPYLDLPKKSKFNLEKDVVEMAKHDNRMVAVRAFNSSCEYMTKLNRVEAKEALASGAVRIQTDVDTMSCTITCEEYFDALTQYSQPLITNLEYYENLLEDFTVQWDDAWGRMKALSSSLSREFPSCAGVYAPGAEMYDIRGVQKQLNTICSKLKDYYKSKGLNTQVIDNYIDVIREMEEKWNKINFQDDEGPVVCFNLKIN